MPNGPPIDPKEVCEVLTMEQDNWKSDNSGQFGRSVVVGIDKWVYKEEHCNSWMLADVLTRLSGEGWDLVKLLGEPRDIPYTNGVIPDQQFFLVRRPADSAEGTEK